jgi:hypothetical protein
MIADEVLDDSPHAGFVVEDDARHFGDLHTEAAERDGTQTPAKVFKTNGPTGRRQPGSDQDQPVHARRVNELVNFVMCRADRIRAKQWSPHYENEVAVVCLTYGFEAATKLRIIA